MKNETNQQLIKNNEEKVVKDLKEFNSIQNELVEKSKGKFVKAPNKPSDKKYTRKTLTFNLAVCLVFIYKHYKYTDCKMTDYFPKKELLLYLKDFPNITRNFHHLKYWDLIAQMPTSPTEVKYKKGWYGITENGIAFLQKEIGLPKYAFVYNDFAYEHQPNPYVMINDLIEDEALEELLKPN